MIHGKGLRTAAVSVLIVAGLIGSASAQGRAELSPQELMRLLKTAKPAPNPIPPSGISKTPGRPGHSAEFDLTTGKQRLLPLIRSIGKGGSKDDGNTGAGAPRNRDGRSDHAAAGATEGSDADIQGKRITPTQPSPILGTTSFPWRSVYKMLMRFNVGGTDFYYVCSASARGSFLILTAGHCIYNWDPNDDDNTSDRRWANEVWVWPAQTDRVVPIGDLDFPYGQGKGILLRSFTGWTSDQNLNFDYGVVTLDRRLGDHTGWMGANTNVGNSLNFDGYPTETPYVPAGEYRQYPGFDSGNVVSSTANRITLDAFTYGGHSGGPAWQFNSSTNERNIQGINSTSNRTGRAGETRITSDIVNHFVAARNDDEANRPPVARPNLIEYLFNTSSKDLQTNSVDQGGSINVEYNAFNAGFATASGVNVDFYLSTNTIISTGDTFLGTRSLGSLNAFSFSNPVTSLPISATQPPGFYYVGWIMRTTTTEYESSDNTVVISNETVQVKEKLTPPAQVTSLVSPKGQITSRRPVFRWGPAARATSYLLSIQGPGGSNIFRGTFSSATLGCTSVFVNCEVRLAEADSLTLGKHKWRVKSINAAGDGPVSVYQGFKVVRPTAAVAAVGD